MTRNRTIWIAVTTALMLGVSVSAADASSSTLLSGYGGPGEGNQAIIGSTLIGGGGSGSSGGSGSAAGKSSAPAPIALTTGTSSSPGKGSSHSGTKRHSSGSRTNKGAKHAGPSPVAPAARSLQAQSATASGGTGTLGLTGDDALYIVIGLCALVLIAALTARLAGRPGAAGETQ